MIVYVEAVVIDNLVVDFVLLFLVKKTLREKVCKWGIATACLFGVGFALSSPLLLFDGALGVFVKIAQAFLMCVMLDFGFKKVILKTVLLFLYTFMFGGMLTAFFNFLGVSTISGMYVGYISSYPLGAVLAALIFMFYLCFTILNRLFKIKKVKQFCLPVSLKINGKNAVVTGFCDSGNMLKSKKGKPVLMLNSNSLWHWFNKEQQLRLLLFKPPSFTNNFEIISVKSAVAEEKVILFSADECVFKGKTFDVMVGVFKMQNSVFDVILNNTMVVENV